jgi:hypothetical protein
MKEGYIVNKTIGTGLYIEVYNYKALNEISHYRYLTNPNIDVVNNRVGVWKAKLIKQQ